MAHTHDGIDWPSRLTAMRRGDELAAPGNSTVAERLVGLVRDGATVADIGPGAGGMSAALATEHTVWSADRGASMPGATGLAVGWTRARADVGLVGVSSFSSLTDSPAPASELVRQSAVDWLTWVSAVAAERLDRGDQDAVVR